jgi:hypothetical protein
MDVNEILRENMSLSIQMFRFCCQVANRSVLVWCVRSALEHQSDQFVQNWLYSAQLTQILVSFANDICCSKTAVEAKHILQSCLAKAKDGGRYSSEIDYLLYM